jgi:protein PhnA
MQDLFTRANNQCEICKSKNSLNPFEVQPRNEEVLLCDFCIAQITNTSKIDENHFHCLNDTMWSEIDAIKVLTYRLFKAMNKTDMLEEMYLDDDVRIWAEGDILNIATDDYVAP